ncbi:HAD family hydrolase [Nocardioides sp. ChNu-99]|uniref:HAD family hydrolase n=1 Tax=Nocardioides sp. ChNu-99 TaxID=2839897 RepID=UPI002405A0F1|nr:HAD family hydrolase [Nocardioides sp. ChNu-99]MDF9717503.1 HAD family hydrolase [Nocardioides sp. ChNu-99]
MSGRGLLVASDLDRTLIYSAAAMQLGEAVAEPVCVEVYDGRPTSFMDPAALDALGALSERTPFVPVTTRTREQFGRIVLPGVRSTHAVTTNGAVILDGGTPCPEWAAEVRRRTAGGASYLDATRALRPVWEHPWVRKVRDAEEQFVYAVVEPALTPAEWYDELADATTALGWVLSVQGRKAYVIPPGLTKEAAVAEVARRIGADAVAAAGDSWLDAGMLAAADHAVRPAHGELHAQEWSTPGLRVTTAAGGRAAAEIVAAFDGWEREGASGWSTVSSDPLP